jgi:hypothetical protein
MHALHFIKAPQQSTVPSIEPLSANPLGAQQAAWQMAAASDAAGSFLKDQQAKAARLRDATDAAAAFKDLESHAGHVYKVSGPRECAFSTAASLKQARLAGFR